MTYSGRGIVAISASGHIGHGYASVQLCVSAEPLPQALQKSLNLVGDSSVYLTVC